MNSVPVPAGQFSITTQSGAQYEFGAADESGLRSVTRNGEPIDGDHSEVIIEGSGLSHQLGHDLSNPDLIVVGQRESLVCRVPGNQPPWWVSTPITAVTID